MPLIKHDNSKSYIVNGQRVVDLPANTEQRPFYPVYSSYWNRYKGNNSSNGDILEQLFRDVKRRNGH